MLISAILITDIANSDNYNSKLLISATELLLSTFRISDINNLHELVISLIRIIDISNSN